MHNLSMHSALWSLCHGGVCGFVEGAWQRDFNISNTSISSFLKWDGFEHQKLEAIEGYNRTVLYCNR
jgi:hypothetical protein